MDTKALIITVASGIFLVGYIIGLLLFTKSPVQNLCAVLCGVAAVVVATAVIFVGCSAMMK